MFAAKVHLCSNSIVKFKKESLSYVSVGFGARLRGNPTSAAHKIVQIGPPMSTIDFNIRVVVFATIYNCKDAAPLSAKS